MKYDSSKEGADTSKNNHKEKRIGQQFECLIIEVISVRAIDFFELGVFWKVKVKYNCYGYKGETSLFLDSKKEVDKVKPEYLFFYIK
ncbi:hypothetical protein [Elizabethkingia ursingii]|uniref:hypothetical protein n=1 Tax=Elizabethkingia ursingii TaxID=1756150 RepID=UPI000750D8DE|nr:hypothetical protein [Elizabethkingia ursingii]KUY29801.1 hypothetical protein ATB96_17840 [Elizabethkingia ursingii]